VKPQVAGSWVSKLGVFISAVAPSSATGSSPAALRGFAGDAAYGAAKAGQLGLTRCLAAELAPHGITVNAVVPGYVPTEMTGGLSDKSRAAIEASIPAGRPARPEEIAAAVAYLTRSEAAYVTGVTLPVDGGIVL
jgi:3-oxoacyl-[acyl-carrier protein] reductase